LDKLIPHTDLILYDLKEIDAENHRSFTGQSNAAVFESLIFIYECMVARRYPGQLWIRTPIIPGATAREENIRGIGQFMAANLGNVIKRWELCAFNNLCKDKYRRLGLSWEFENSQLMNASEMENLADVAKNSGVNPEIVHWSGSTRLEEDAGHLNPNKEFKKFTTEAQRTQRNNIFDLPGDDGKSK
jgi:pyruvate formate lyase activating enzyme